MAFSRVGASRSKSTLLRYSIFGSLQAALLVHKMGDGRHDARFVEDRRPDAGDQTAGLEMALLEHRHAGVVGLRRLFGLRVLQVGEGLELHDRPGQLLGQSVVDFVGDELPFVVAGLQQVFEGAMFSLQCLLGPLALGNVMRRN